VAEKPISPEAHWQQAANLTMNTAKMVPPSTSNLN